MKLVNMMKTDLDLKLIGHRHSSHCNSENVTEDNVVTMT